MNYAAIKLGFEVFLFFFNAGIGLYVWLSNRNRARRVELESVAQRVTIIEQDIKHLPNHDHLSTMSSRIEDLHRDVASMGGALEGIRRAVDLMNEHLLNRGGRHE